MTVNIILHHGTILLLSNGRGGWYNTAVDTCISKRGFWSGQQGPICDMSEVIWADPTAPERLRLAIVVQDKKRVY